MTAFSARYLGKLWVSFPLNIGSIEDILLSGEKDFIHK
jgi:hypothetical protein